MTLLYGGTVHCSVTVFDTERVVVPLLLSKGKIVKTVQTKKGRRNRIIMPTLTNSGVSPADLG